MTLLEILAAITSVCVLFIWLNYTTEVNKSLTFLLCILLDSYFKNIYFM